MKRKKAGWSKPSKWFPCWQEPPKGFNGGRCIGARHHQRGNWTKHRNVGGEEWS